MPKRDKHKSPYVQPTLEGTTLSSLSDSQLYALSASCAAGGALAALLAASYLVCPVSQLCADTHYKYLVPLLVPVTAWFAIANWVGWQYFRHA
ncbi:hypothetical protein VHUM_01130 [Vanrija humicola]|uniref:Uncharacterized protein n=1 Tax=Vanrija humicola TaxID=5417 RepID=A0A7D8V2V9_VANHU|nr:hypothetical protein VHUM_01130 [Vanrija humicola]